MKLQDATVALYLQHQLRSRDLDCVTAIEANEWLARASILKNSASRPGLPLRNLLRAKRIPGGRQESNRRWFIERIVLDTTDLALLEE
jgi:hypothetical protein